jgi:hypothetical protein
MTAPPAARLVCQGQWNNELAVHENFACVEEGAPPHL